MTKLATIEGQVIRLFSDDGKAWASRRRDLTAFRRRLRKDKQYLTKYFQSNVAATFTYLNIGDPMESFGICPRRTR